MKEHDREMLMRQDRRAARKTLLFVFIILLPVLLVVAGFLAVSSLHS